jgi:hypothetical protein
MNAKYVGEVFRIHKFISKHGFKIEIGKGNFEVKKSRGNEVLATFRTLEMVEAYVVGRVEK